MADLASSAVNILESYEVGDRFGKRRCFRLRVELTLTGQGSTTNKIPASALGLESITRVSNGVTDGNTIFPAGVSHDGLNILLAKLTEATDGNRANAQDLSDVIRLTVEGSKRL